jgi:F-type H+-transporting ATPase subunit gamma
MPSLIDIRRRIRSVKNTQQITKAMKMVSAAKLRRAQDRVIAARPYAAQMRDLLADLAAAVESQGDATESAWLARREPKRIDLILITSDKGLAGAFNSSIIKAGQRFLAEHADAENTLTLVGRKGRDYYKRRHGKILAEHVNILNRPSFDDARRVSGEIIRRYRDGETDAVYLLNNEFKSVMTQQLSVAQLLPVVERKTAKAEQTSVDYIYEQPPIEMLDQLMPRYVEVAVFRALLETVAAEHAARMTAMDKASTNAREVIDTLTLNMNRIRQAFITKEIIEVVSGAAAAEES